MKVHKCYKIQAQVYIKAFLVSFVKKIIDFLILKKTKI